MNTRFQCIIEILQLKQTVLARELGVSEGTIRGIVSGRIKSISGELLVGLQLKYNINPVWLITGDGEMFLTSQNTASEPQKKPANSEPKKLNHLSVHEGNVQEYPDIDDSDQIARTAWYRALPDDGQFIVNAIDELRDLEALKVIGDLCDAAVSKQRATARMDEQLEILNKLAEERGITRESRKKGEAG